MGLQPYLILAAVVFSIGLFILFRNRDAAENAVPALAVQQAAPEGPKLLIDEPGTLQQYLSKEAQTLATYGWEDKNAGVVRLPISRAIDLVAERGLPQFSAKDQAKGAVTRQEQSKKP